jgi:hypothetical protein
MDITQIPKSMNIDVNQWLHYLTAIGVNLINPYEEGWNIAGREGGKPASFNQMSSVDLTMSNVIAGYIQLIDKIEDKIGELSGVSKARQGNIHQSSLVGNVEREVTQSSLITEPIFYLHNNIKKKIQTALIEVAKSAYDNGNIKKLHYVFSDSTRIFMEVSPDFLYADFDIFVSDSTKESQNIEALKGLLQPAMQNGATLLDVAEILAADNLSQIKGKLGEIEKARQEAMQAQQEAEQQQLQMQAQIKAEENRIKEEDSIRKSETDIQVALINAENRLMTAQNNNQDNKDTIDLLKLELERDKMQKDTELKAKQISEDIRKNKIGEDIKRQELQIKRKQVSKNNNKTK